MSKAKKPGTTRTRDVNANIEQAAPKTVKKQYDQRERLNMLLDRVEQISRYVIVPDSPDKPKKSSTKKGKNHQVGNNVTFDRSPDYINGEMRDYQVHGLNWLISLHQNGVNGILADEMGLGKTLQTISLLGFLKEYHNINGPFLVIGPKSTISNWMNEVRRFSRSLIAVSMIGEKSQRPKIMATMMNPHVMWDVCVTTYNMILNEFAFFRKYNWQYIVVDEGHRMKNEFNMFSTKLRQLKSAHRLLITGTPLQNNLHELWALLNYLLPDIFKDAADFDSWFDSNDCLAGNDDIANRLKIILKPLMLRRVKADVEKSLLPKLEVKLFVGMTALQHDVYCRVLRKEVVHVNMMGEHSLKTISNIMMELRKAANHPYLIDNVEPQPFTTDENLMSCCGKMMLLDKLLTKLKGQGSRVLIFSQFVMVLNILDDYLNWRGHKYSRLDGSTTYEQRALDIDAFNAPNSDTFVYLISTKAGGLGINLATADTVIIYDSDWNPQSDAQAIDRAHRIGQKKQVRVFRLITENTIDERIVQRAEIKLRLDRMIINNARAPQKDAKANKTDMIDIIRFGAEHILSDEFEGIVDVDIEQILKDGAVKTNAENAKYAKMKEEELRNLTLHEASTTKSVYDFEGVDYRKLTSAPVEAMPAVRSTRVRGDVQYVEPRTEPVKLVTLHDFQFFPPALYLLCVPGTFKIDINAQKEIKEALYNEGFSKWDRSDFKKFYEALIHYGAEDFESIATHLPDKTLDEVTKYTKVFMLRGPTEVKMYSQIDKSLKAKNKQRALRKKKIEMFQWKCAKYTNPAEELVIRANGTEQKDLNDNYLVRALFEIGIETENVYRLIHGRIHASLELQNNKFMLDLTVKEIEKRIDALLKVIEQEHAIETGSPISSPKKKQRKMSPSKSSPKKKKKTDAGSSNENEKNRNLNMSKDSNQFEEIKTGASPAKENDGMSQAGSSNEEKREVNTSPSVDIGESNGKKANDKPEEAKISSPPKKKPKQTKMVDPSNDIDKERSVDTSKDLEANQSDRMEMVDNLSAVPPGKSKKTQKMAKISPPSANDEMTKASPSKNLGKKRKANVSPRLETNNPNDELNNESNKASKKRKKIDKSDTTPAKKDAKVYSPNNSEKK